MKPRNVKELDQAVVETRAWVDDLARRLGWREHGKAYAALIGGLHALRDALPGDEVAFLGAQLPPLLRGLYYEGWHAGSRPAHSVAAITERVHEAVGRDPGIDAEQASRAVFALLAARLPASEVEDLIARTPKSIHPLWPS